MTAFIDVETPECLEFGDVDHCSGPVELRESLTGTGTRIPRCDRHWDRRLDREEELRAAYPDSPNAPTWFDSSYAGETWDDGEGW